MEDGERGKENPKQKSAFPSPHPPVVFPLWTLFSLNLHLLTSCRLLLFYKGFFERLFLLKMKRKFNVERQLSKGRALKHLSLTIKSKSRQSGGKLRKGSAEGKTKEGGEMPTFTAVFSFSPFLWFLLCMNAATTKKSDI